MGLSLGWPVHLMWLQLRFKVQEEKNKNDMIGIIIFGECIN